MTILPRSLIVYSAVLASVWPKPAAAAEAVEAPDDGAKTTVALSIKQDTFFGFHGLSQILVSVADQLDVTFYAILWTSPRLGSGEGANLWTEWGAGVNLELLDGALLVNPQLGVLNGVLLSSASRGLAFEGIVPNLTLNYARGPLEAQVYGGFYLGLRTLDESRNRDFLHYWANAGFVPVTWLSAGVHWEHLVQTRGLGATNRDVDDVYMWFGGYVEAKAGSGFLRFAAGVDLEPDDVADFYQVSTGIRL